MRKIFVLFAILLGANTAIAQAQTVTVWQGKAEVLTALPTSACAPGFNSTGPKRFEFMDAVFRPANISDNGASTILTFTRRDRTIDRHVISGQSFAGNGSYDGRQLTGKGGHNTYVGNFENVAVFPQTITATTMFVQIRAKFTNFHNKTGCTVDLRAAYVRRLN